MNGEVRQELFLLLREVLCKGLQQENNMRNCEEVWEDLLSVSREYDIAQIICYALINKQSTDKKVCYEEIQKQIMLSVYRYERMNYDFRRITTILEKNQISFIPLKGAIIREFYPEPWMRTSGDIDILVRPEELSKAVLCLVNELNYKEGNKSSHDISLYSPNDIHLELHYQLVEEGWANQACYVLEQVWNTANNKEGYRFWYEMSDEMFYFYHIAHMAKHFEQGGCGIKPYLDLWILDKVKVGDQARRNEVLARGELLKFAEASRKLSRVWLAGEESDCVTDNMQEYILNGGVQGTFENRVAVQQLQRGGKIRYIISKIFIPYEVIKFQYPILQQHRWLTPVMEVRRWGKLLFCGHARRVAKELQYGNSFSKVEVDTMRKFLNEIGL